MSVTLQHFLNLKNFLYALRPTLETGKCTM